MDRRTFTHLCSSLFAGAATLSQQLHAAPKNTVPDGQSHENSPWPESQLMNRKGEPLRFDSLAVGSSHIFAYPFKTTPCFLIRLQPASAGVAELTDRAGQTYQWLGGVGADQSLVAFSAICTHKMTHPARPVSHLNFRPEEKTYYDADGKEQRQPQLITCCSEYSIYDPAVGAKVMSGPATQPLAAVSLRVDADTGEIFATGSYGGNLFDEFLTKFGFRLAMESKVSDPRTLATGTTTATPADEYSAQQIRC